MCQMLQYQQHIDHVNYNTNSSDNTANTNNSNEESYNSFDELDKEAIESTKKGIISHRSCSFVQYSISLHENSDLDHMDREEDNDKDINDVYLPPFVRKPLEDIRQAANPIG